MAQRYGGETNGSRADGETELDSDTFHEGLGVQGGLGLLADFLIAASGEIVARHYGKHADDQWSVDEVLALAR